jgi:DNA-binding response OmpR family regulator
VSLNHAAVDTIGDVLMAGGFDVAITPRGETCASLDASPWRAVGLVAGDAEECIPLCREIRSRGYPGALLLLGACPRDVGALLDAGIDDFVLAPFNPSELTARVRMAVRRRVARREG